MEILRRILNKVRPRKEKTFGETISEERRIIEEESRRVLEVAPSKEGSEEKILATLYSLMQKLHANPLIARESLQTAQIILGLFVNHKSPRIRILCARVLLALHTSKNPLVISQLPIILKTEKNPAILHMFENVNF